MWVRGLKQILVESILVCCTSHPMWVRGLKLFWAMPKEKAVGVASYVGAWIETQDILLMLQDYEVASYVGAWIETRLLDLRT